MWILMGNQQVEADFGTFRPEVFVFDWDGNFVNRLKLDRSIITFAVSEQHKELYAVSFLDEDIKTRILISCIGLNCRDFSPNRSLENLAFTLH